jgi:predicted pyridoxine 5'-phosphate oxidase superfamily flavin-nucleotide-binding protein
MTEDLGAVQDRTFATATAATAASYPPERRLPAGELASYLDRRAFAVIGTARPDGRPHAAMTSYVRRGATFWLPTVAGSVRERNLRAEPWLTLVVTEGDRDRHVVVLLEGPAAIIDPAEVPADVRAAAPGDWISSWLRFTAQRVLSYAAAGALA